MRRSLWSTYTENDLFNTGLKVAEAVQAWYMSGNMSKSPYGSFQ